MPGKVKKAAQQLDGTQRLPRRLYETELYRLQGELVKMQEWVRAEGARIVVIFEGRDAAGKGSTIKRVTRVPEPPRRADRRAARADRAGADAVVLPALRRSPARRGRAGAVRPQLVQPGRAWSTSWGSAPRRSTAGSCTSARSSSGCWSRTASCCASTGSRSATRSRSAGSESRLDDPMRRWKLSPMDLESITRWEDYSRAKDEMFVHTDIPEAPWHVVESDDKRRARINMIAHLLSTIPYHDVRPPTLKLPPRPPVAGIRPRAPGHAGLRPRPRRRAGYGGPGLAAGPPAGPNRPRRRG